MDTEEEGTKEEGALAAEAQAPEETAPCCGGENHSAATCPCMSHRPSDEGAQTAPEEAPRKDSEVLVDLASGALVVLFNEHGEAKLLCDGSSIAPIRLHTAAKYLETMGDILLHQHVGRQVQQFIERARAGIVGAAPGGARAAARRLRGVPR